jgi:hypothetical protein
VFGRENIFLAEPERRVDVLLAEHEYCTGKRSQGGRLGEIYTEGVREGGREGGGGRYFLEIIEP